MSKQLVVEIVGDASKFNKATADATAASSKFGLSQAAILGAAGLAAGAIVAVGSEALKLGAQYEALDAKAETVFGASLGQVDAWADANARAMGLTTREATGLATSMGDLLIPMGFTRDQAAGMSTDIVGLSGALAEWSGGTKSSAEVSEILQKALLGERDGLKALGISISEADVAAQLAADGNDKLTGSALAQAKALATQELIFAKSTDAQTAYTAGTAKGIRAQHEMDAQLNEVKETLVTAVYPVLQTVSGFLAENLPGAIKFAQDAFRNLQPVFEIVFGALGLAVDVVSKIIGTAVDIWTAEFNLVKSIITGVVDAIKGAVNVAIAVVNGVIDAINSFEIHVSIPNPLGGDIARVDWDGLNLGKIAFLHAGGIVPGTPGSDVPAILQAGERVLPAGSPGDTINVTINVEGSQDPEATARAVMQAFQRERLRQNMSFS